MFVAICITNNSFILENFEESLILYSHSEVVESGTTGKQGITTFDDLDAGYGMEITSRRDETYDSVVSDDAKLGDFMKRPVLIYSDRWSTTAPTAVNATFNPWKLFCEDPAVLEKLKYFNNLSGKLVVKFMVNGNSFLYGRLMCSYEPVPDFNDLSLGNLTERDYVLFSQRPKIFLNPTTNEGGSMHLPFFWYNNYLNIPASEWDQMGEITLSAIAPLLHASGEDQSVSVTVYAYMEEVVLATPTALQSQSEILYSHAKQTSVTKKDEYGTGIISKPASSLAAAAGWLTKMPTVAPYARATQMIASSVGECARLFGYSRPPYIDGVKPVKIVTASAFATVDQEDGPLKLTLDSKCETTIDARTVGLSGDDHMGIYDIAQKESFLTSFDWATYEQGDIPGTTLFSANVTPSLSNNVDADEVNMTPMAMMSQLFTFWHGTIVMRFQVVASNFHKGRLRIQYDPQGVTSLDENKQYTEIIDIAETRDFEISIGWGVSRPFLNIARVGQLVGGDHIEYRENAVIPLSTQSNGQIRISVLNELTVPGDPNTASTAPPIQMNVFVKAGDDMKFSVPNASYIDDLSLTPLISQSDITVLESHSEVTTDATTDHSSMENKPGETLSKQLNPENSRSTDHLTEVFFGEHVTSLRDLFRRYSFHTAWALPPVGANKVGGNDIRNKVFPFHRASFATTAGIREVATGVENYSINPATTIPLTYCSPAFVGWRGSIRRKMVNNAEAGSNTRMMVPRRLPYTAALPEVVPFTIDSELEYFTGGSFTRFAAAGQELLYTRNNACVEFENPYYLNQRFSSTKKLLAPIIQSETLVVSDFVQSAAAQNTTKYVLDYVSTGEDFTLFFFLNCPRFYRWEIPLDS